MISRPNMKIILQYIFTELVQIFMQAAPILFLVLVLKRKDMVFHIMNNFTAFEHFPITLFQYLNLCL